MQHRATAAEYQGGERERMMLTDTPDVACVLSDTTSRWANAIMATAAALLQYEQHTPSLQLAGIQGIVQGQGYACSSGTGLKSYKPQGPSIAACVVLAPCKHVQAVNTTTLCKQGLSTAVACLAAPHPVRLRSCVSSPRPPWLAAAAQTPGTPVHTNTTSHEALTAQHALHS